MPRKKKSSVEIIRANPVTPTLQVGQANLEAVLDRLVRERVAEVLANPDDTLLSTEFLSKRLADEIRRHQTTFARHRWTLFFERHGCRDCHRKKVLHAGTGYCERCRNRVVYRLKAIERELAKQYGEHNDPRGAERFASRILDAERLLNGGA